MLANPRWREKDQVFDRGHELLHRGAARGSTISDAIARMRGAKPPRSSTLQGRDFEAQVMCNRKSPGRRLDDGCGWSAIAVARSSRGGRLPSSRWAMLPYPDCAVASIVNAALGGTLRGGGLGGHTLESERLAHRISLALSGGAAGMAIITGAPWPRPPSKSAEKAVLVARGSPETRSSHRKRRLCHPWRQPGWRTPPRCGWRRGCA